MLGCAQSQQAVAGFCWLCLGLTYEMPCPFRLGVGSRGARQPEHGAGVSAMARLEEGPGLFRADRRERGAGGSWEDGKGEKDSEA